MAIFATTYAEFPEANQPLGPGKNENTYGIVIHRAHGQGDYAKVFLSDEEAAKLAETKEFYIFVKGPFYPLAVLIDTPFISAEQQALELEYDIEKVNTRLREQQSLERVSNETLFEKAISINEYFPNVFEDVPYLIKRMKENSAAKLE